MKRTTSAIIGAFALLIVFSMVLSSWYTVDQTQRGVLLRNGALVTVVQPGLHFKLPWFEAVAKIDMQTHNFHWDKVNSYSADQQPADIKVSVTLHVAPDKVAEMYSRFGGDYDAAIQRLIAPHVNQQIKNIFGQYTAARAITNRNQLNGDAAKALSEAIAYDPVFAIEGVQIENIDFSPEYIRSVEQRMQAEVEVQKLRQNLEREKVQAEIVVTQANGRAQSIRAEAQAQSDATKLKGEAEAANIKIVGDAQASAIRARAQALGDNPRLIELTQAERWNGTLPSTMVPSAAVPFIGVK